MKRYIFAGVLMFSVASTACAQRAASDAQGAPPVHDSRAASSQVYVAGKCSFTVQLNGGSLSIDDQSYIKGAVYSAPGTEAWSFSTRCHAGASQDEIDQLLDAKKVNGSWIWYNPGAGNIPENPPFSPEQHFRAYSLSGRNWKGIAITYDDTTGDERTRGRNLFFCLVETGGPQVLCGGPMSVMLLGRPESTSTLPKILAVLKTIEFVDAPAQRPAPSSASSQH